MERPTLVHFLAIKTNDYLHIKASITLRSITQKEQFHGIPVTTTFDAESERQKLRSPIEAIKLLSRERFQLKIVGLDSVKKPILKKIVETDGYGSLNTRIDTENLDIQDIQIFEISHTPKIELLLGNFIPLTVREPKKIIICDFDKTLVDTKYSTTKEVYHSLTRPIDYFPTVKESVGLLKNYISQGFHPFILSASPHFYESAMRDWLYKNSIFTAGIFLKDYRQIFSVLEESLTPKDLKFQGLYKLNHLLDILLMTSIPHELVLMGDNFESDPIIYLCLSKFLHQEIDPWNFCHFLQKHDAFKMNEKQTTQILNKLYKLSGDIKKHGDLKIKIYIRKKIDEQEIDVPKELDNKKPLVKLYQALPSPKALEENQKLHKKWNEDLSQ